ncbi:hypothetical protein [Virgibacillus sp. SK37]|nr:hypothetical protein [Virgibacillus sp. SK37]AIF45720.1 hypothetical protein X953_19790 [Virgibacillus sp. SK37]
MYEVINATMKETVLIYIVFISASLLTFPVVQLIYTAIERGSSKWR